MIEVVRYSQDKKEEWDRFVEDAKNGTFLFHRNYMEYHSDRFEDYSLMLYKKGKLASIFPGNIKNSVFYSHQGLTFGGIVIEYKTGSLTFLEYLNFFNEYLLRHNVKKVVYKTIPQVYKTHFGEEEVYGLYRLGAKTVACNLSSCIDLNSDLLLSRNRLRSYKKTIKNNVATKRSEEFGVFWDIMCNNMMSKYNTKPVHTIDEMYRLKNSFPNNIELLVSSQNDEVLAGAIVYKFNHVLKVQYAHASCKGKQLCAIDNIYQHLISNEKGKYRYIDFGTSCLNNGHFINKGLLRQKEGFGARGIVFNIYEYNPEMISF